MQRKARWAVLGCFLAIFLLPGIAELWVYREVQNRLRVRIDGSYVPMFFRPSFQIRKAHFAWDDKVEFLSGDLTVEYNLFSLIPENRLRLRLYGQQVEIQLLGEWARIQGVERTVVDHFNADLSIGPEGLDQVYSLEIDSPIFQFRILESEV